MSKVFFPKNNVMTPARPARTLNKRIATVDHKQKRQEGLQGICRGKEKGHRKGKGKAIKNEKALESCSIEG